MIHHNHEQGSEAWLAARKGCITGSRFKDCRDKLKSGGPSKACIAYAQDTARERIGGAAPAKFQNAAMRTGTGALPSNSAPFRRKSSLPDPESTQTRAIFHDPGLSPEQSSVFCWGRT